MNSAAIEKVIFRQIRRNCRQIESNLYQLVSVRRQKPIIFVLLLFLIAPMDRMTIKICFPLRILQRNDQSNFFYVSWDTASIKSRENNPPRLIVPIITHCQIGITALKPSNKVRRHSRDYGNQGCQQSKYCRVEWKVS